MDSFYVIGISVRTTNVNAQAKEDLGALWGQFFADGVAEKIPHKLSSEVYCVYTDYAGDAQQPYTAILGCKVKDLSEIPEGMVGKEIPAGHYKHYPTKGVSGVIATWQEIWQSNLKRTYGADYELHQMDSANPDEGSVDIYLGVEE